ncbi:MAG: amidohydrolase [Clostridia bacterium]|nr:amidohydrolase [Clostridia bacterium]
MQKLLLTHCSALVPDGANGYTHLDPAFVGITNDTITYIGSEAPEGEWTKKDLHGALLIPGLVNAHTHAAMTLLRGRGSGLPLDRWLNEAIFPIEDRMTREDMAAGNALAQLEMLRTGTTSYSDMYYNLDTEAELTLQSGMKVNLGRAITSFDPNESALDSYRVRETLDLFDAWHGKANGRIRVDFSIHAEYTCTERMAREFAALGAERGARMHLHLSETVKEHAACKAKYGKTPTEWFRDLGVLALPTAAAHCVTVEDGDLEILKACGVSPVHNPSSNLKLGSGVMRLKSMLDAGLNVGLGTDGAASNDNLNMIEEMHIAALLHNGALQDPTAIRPADVLNMASVNGARLQGRSDTGVLAVGKKADIAAIALDAPHLMPMFDPLALLTYSVSGSDVCMTMVDGKILYENGEYFTLDAERIRFEARAALNRLYGA